jgi:CheY-like chemotaxis protein
MRVMVVEDDKAVADVFADYLTTLGHQPLVVRSAEAALAALPREHPQAIILDVQLPGMSGLEFLEVPRVRADGVPVVAVSGVATEAEARECLRLGAIDFVGKPITFERLSGVLEFLELDVLSRRAAGDGRRRSPRAPVDFPVRALPYGGALVAGTACNLSALALKARLATAVAPRTAVKPFFAPPDGGPALQVLAILARKDADGDVLRFVNLQERDHQRLDALVRRLLP